MSVGQTGDGIGRKCTGSFWISAVLGLIASCGTNDSTPDPAPIEQQRPAEPAIEAPQEPATEPPAEAEAEVDPETECRRSFVLLDEGEPAEALEAARGAIEQLRRRNGEESRPLLAACLYNRGRAFEALGRGREATRDYAESAWIRPNDTVRSRLFTLVPTTQVDAPESAIAIAETLLGEDPLPESDDPDWNESIDLDIERGRGSDGLLWSVVVVSPGVSALSSAIAFLFVHTCGGMQMRRLDSADYDNTNFMSLERVRALRHGGEDLLVTRLEGGGDDNCGQMDGMMDFERKTLSISFVSDCRLRSRTFSTEVDECGDQVEPDRVDVTFEREGKIRIDDRNNDANDGLFSVHELVN